ncbi:hypothetical protein KVR01_002523 [Diaporthe batatas]|uniref:uncharacterized protein n=1 Tax=Diaporthe batatas TaxID=748121 RepID=UPI001D039BC2|nr:uncharacterized protein KVR01_002523 [Diaporthe batatas]KAG8166834.1 hypothetical protein KVR01_002523 [Diaporthe batatas]
MSLIHRSGRVVDTPVFSLIPPLPSSVLHTLPDPLGWFQPLSLSLSFFLVVLASFSLFSHLILWAGSQGQVDQIRETSAIRDQQLDDSTTRPRRTTDIQSILSRSKVQSRIKMPVPLAAKAGVIAVSVAVAAAIAIYESPELQRMATDLRRRIALALHSLGDGIGPEAGGATSREPLFNRPEDAEGFLQSGDVDADEDSRKRQREELLYWNAVKLSQELEKQTAENEKLKESGALERSGTTFDDFLQKDETSNEKGTYVFNTGADVRNNDDGLVRRRGASEGVRGLNSSIYANPFADEHGIDYNEMEDSEIAPEKDEVMSTDDIYTASPRPADSILSRTLSPAHDAMPELIPAAEPPRAVQELLFDATQPDSPSASTPRDSASEAELGQDEYMTAGQSDREGEHDAYASIQAWAEQQQQAQMQNHESSRDFYSPLPVTPAAPLSEMSDGELVSEGQLTPTDSASVAGSGFDVANEIAASQNGSSKYYDVLSEDEDGIPTPAHSWTEVGSVVSESEDGHRPAARS